MAGVIYEHDPRHPKHPDYGKSEREAAALKKKQDEHLAKLKAEQEEREAAALKKEAVKVPERSKTE